MQNAKLKKMKYDGDIKISNMLFGTQKKFHKYKGLIDCKSDEVIVNPSYGDVFEHFQAANICGRGRKCDSVNPHLA